MPGPDLDRLLAQLNVSGLQQRDNPLYQVISQLIKTTKEVQEALVAVSGGSAGLLATSTFLTHTPQTPTLPNSRNLLAGTDVTFDDSIFGERTINVSSSGSDTYDAPLTDGDEDETDLIFADGECVIVQVPNP